MKYLAIIPAMVAFAAAEPTPDDAIYCRVEAVSRLNLRGPICAPVAAATLATSEKACSPAPVLDLHAILVSPLAPLNQVNLLWRSNIEPDVAGYEVHRSIKPGFTPGADTKGTNLSKRAALNLNLNLNPSCPDDYAHD